MLNAGLFHSLLVFCLELRYLSIFMEANVLFTCYQEICTYGKWDRCHGKESNNMHFQIFLTKIYVKPNFFFLLTGNRSVHHGGKTA